MDLLDANDYTGLKTTLVTLLHLEAIMCKYTRTTCVSHHSTLIFLIYWDVEQMCDPFWMINLSELTRLLCKLIAIKNN